MEIAVAGGYRVEPVTEQTFHHSTEREFQFILSSCIITIFEVATMPLGNNEGRSEMNQIKIGKFIAERRKERGFLQKDIAIRLGISEKAVSKWECGNGLPEVIYMEPLCQILGITVNELLAGETIPILELLSNRQQKICCKISK